ncbi:MAG: hypothetical protein JAY74_24560, partial [Candidatus Thiodiazotropha taylori]|nr:hypothetical protein [Candidatus Thiodiazotropha taylori]
GKGLLCLLWVWVGLFGYFSLIYLSLFLSLYTVIRPRGHSRQVCAVSAEISMKYEKKYKM